MWLERATAPCLPLGTQAALEEQVVDILLPPQLLSVLLQTLPAATNHRHSLWAIFPSLNLLSLVLPVLLAAGL